MAMLILFALLLKTNDEIKEIAGVSYFLLSLPLLYTMSNFVFEGAPSDPTWFWIPSCLFIFLGIIVSILEWQNIEENEKNLP